MGRRGGSFRPLLLDLFCKAGGTSMGYHMAGWEVVGVDIEPQPRYPFRFIQADVRRLKASAIRRRFKGVAASPPCQRFSPTAAINGSGHRHEDLIEETRELLESTGLPYAIENVPGAPLVDPIQLCGSYFGLRVRRHRLFETNFEVSGVPCRHNWQTRHTPYPISQTARGGVAMRGCVPVFGRSHVILGEGPGGNRFRGLHYRSVAMGIDWMLSDELSQAVPPAFTLHVGRAMRLAL